MYNYFYIQDRNPFYHIKLPMINKPEDEVEPFQAFVTSLIDKVKNSWEPEKWQYWPTQVIYFGKDSRIERDEMFETLELVEFNDWALDELAKEAGLEEKAKALSWKLYVKRTIYDWTQISITKSYHCTKDTPLSTSSQREWYEWLYISPAGQETIEISDPDQILEQLQEFDTLIENRRLRKEDIFKALQ